MYLITKSNHTGKHFVYKFFREPRMLFSFSETVIPGSVFRIIGAV